MSAFYPSIQGSKKIKIFINFMKFKNLWNRSLPRLIIKMIVFIYYKISRSQYGLPFSNNLINRFKIG